MEKRDFFFSLFLFALGAGVVVESLRMPRMENSGYGPYSAPGLVPGLIGAAISFCALLLLIRTIRARHTVSESTGLTEETSAEIRALAVTLGLVLLYAVGLVGTIPFWLATFLFMFAFVLYFEWNPAAVRKRKIRTLTTTFAQAAAVAIAVTLLFEKVFRVNLPG